MPPVTVVTPVTLNPSISAPSVKLTPPVTVVTPIILNRPASTPSVALTPPENVEIPDTFKSVTDVAPRVENPETFNPDPLICPSVAIPVTLNLAKSAPSDAFTPAVIVVTPVTVNPVIVV